MNVFSGLLNSVQLTSLSPLCSVYYMVLRVISDCGVYIILNINHILTYLVANLLTYFTYVR